MSKRLSKKAEKVIKKMPDKVINYPFTIQIEIYYTLFCNPLGLARKMTSYF